MTDIVWNLRNDVPCNGDIGCAWELCHQAADEIERLRAALSEIVKQAETACKNVAYRKRIKFYDTPLNEAHDDGALETHEILGGIARAALEEGRT